MTQDILYNTDNIGCYADGAGGHRHVREVLAGLVAPLDSTLASELRGDPPDDLGDETKALERLQEATDNGLVWIFNNGDLLLVKEEDIDGF